MPSLAESITTGRSSVCSSARMRRRASRLHREVRQYEALATLAAEDWVEDWLGWWVQDWVERWLW
jgi:hypothetical protein